MVQVNTHAVKSHNTGAKTHSLPLPRSQCCLQRARWIAEALTLPDTR